MNRQKTAGLAAGAGLLLLATGCGASQPVGGSPTSPAAAGSAAASRTPAVAGVTSAGLKTLAGQYLTVARPANHRLDVANDAYEDAEHDDLAQARRDLHAEIATERTFDRQLLALKLPPDIMATVIAMVIANEARIGLTGRQAAAGSLAAMRAADHRHKAADAAVEDQVRRIRQQFLLPPPDTD